MTRLDLVLVISNLTLTSFFNSLSNLTLTSCFNSLEPRLLSLSTGMLYLVIDHILAFRMWQLAKDNIKHLAKDNKHLAKD